MNLIDCGDPLTFSHPQTKMSTYIKYLKIKWQVTKFFLYTYILPQNLYLTLQTVSLAPPSASASQYILYIILWTHILRTCSDLVSNMLLGHSYGLIICIRVFLFINASFMIFYLSDHHIQPFNIMQWYIPSKKASSKPRVEELVCIGFFHMNRVGQNCLHKKSNQLNSKVVIQ